VTGGGDSSPSSSGPGGRENVRNSDALEALAEDPSALESSDRDTAAVWQFGIAIAIIDPPVHHRRADLLTLVVVLPLEPGAGNDPAAGRLQVRGDPGQIAGFDFLC